MRITVRSGVRQLAAALDCGGLPPRGSKLPQSRAAASRSTPHSFEDARRRESQAREQDTAEAAEDGVHDRIRGLEEEECVLGAAADLLLAPVRGLPEGEARAALAARLIDDGVEAVDVALVRRSRRFGKAHEYAVEGRFALHEQRGAEAV